MDKQLNAQQAVKEDKEDKRKKKEQKTKSVGETEEKITTERTTPEDKNEKRKETDSTEAKEVETQVKLAELQDKYLRLSAEFDNYRKRTLKERIELTKSAAESVLTSLLPVMDDFDRSISIMETVSDYKALKEGINLIYAKMQDFLKQNGVKEIEAMGKEFDTDLHEAVTKIPAEEKKKKGRVVDVTQKGYYLNDKIIRYSKVVVGE
ncbi:MAG TPA: nucleotide exchange factor GrpE [Bacteroidales bacterium]|nr:nucleotide exchange factor GrpE [Bacteroidales bacterium]